MAQTRSEAPSFMEWEECNPTEIKRGSQDDGCGEKNGNLGPRSRFEQYWLNYEALVGTQKNMDMEMDLPTPRRRRKLSRFVPALLAWTLLIAASTAYFIFPGVSIAHKLHIAIPIVQGAIFAVVLANFAVATFMDPGFLPRAQHDEIPTDDFKSPLYKTVDIHGVQIRLKWCVTCNLYRPPRTSHCSTCNRCIEVFDHHCPWVANCVGRRNYRYFLYFLMSLVLHMILAFLGCLHQVLTEQEILHHPVNITSITLMCFIGLMIFPVSGLMFFHFHLVAKANTTNEQVTSKFKNAVNPYDRGCLTNCGTTFCGPLYGKHLLIREQQYAAVQKTDERVPFSPSASPTQVRLDMTDFSDTSPPRKQNPPPVLPKPVLSQSQPSYAFKPARSPPYDNQRSPASASFPEHNNIDLQTPDKPQTAPKPLQSIMKHKMQPVIAELNSRAPTASLSSNNSEGGYHTASSEVSSYTSTRTVRLADHRVPATTHPDTHSRQDSYLTSSQASTPTIPSTSEEFQQRMFRAVDGRNINSPRHPTRKSKAYGNMLKEDVGGTLRATREAPSTYSPLITSSKAVSTSNLNTEDLPIVMYRKNPAIVSSQPSLAVLEKNRKARPRSFVQALETTDSIEQLALLGKTNENAPGDQQRPKVHQANFGEISV